MAALAEEHALARADLRSAETSGDDALRAQALNRLADLQDIAARSLDVVSLEADEARELRTAG
jgi:hypothetical protein